MPNLLKLAQVRAKTTMSTGGIYSGMKSGTFPGSIEISPGRVAWLEDEVDTWIDELIEKNRKATEE